MWAFHRGRFSCGTRDADSACFLTEITRSSCNWASVSDSKGRFIILLVTGLNQIRSFAILGELRIIVQIRSDRHVAGQITILVRDLDIACVHGLF